MYIFIVQKLCEVTLEIDNAVDLLGKVVLEYTVMVCPICLHTDNALCWKSLIHIWDIPQHDVYQTLHLIVPLSPIRLIVVAIQGVTVMLVLPVSPLNLQGTIIS